MIISYSQHKLYMQTSFSESEYALIKDWLRKEVYKGTDENIWRNLVAWFKKLPDTRKSKAFIYQILVLAEAVSGSGFRERTQCMHRINHTCVRWEEFLMNNNPNPVEGSLERDITGWQGLCYDMSRCSMLPEPEQTFWIPDYEEGMVFELDDSCLEAK